MREDNDPARPRAPRIKQGLHRVLDAIIQLEARLDVLADVPPDGGDDKAPDGGDDVDEHREGPGDEDVRCGPEEPGLDVLVYGAPARGLWVWFVPDEVD